MYEYKKALYRRNNFGKPCVWFCEKCTDHSIRLVHGIVGKTLTDEIINTLRMPTSECISRTNAKRKVGYKYLSELKDNTAYPVEGELLNYLETYLPYDRTNSYGAMLPMKAKTYDNTNNKLFTKCPSYYGQWKINGLRCFIWAESNSGDMFKPVKLIFQSIEGVTWNSLSNLEEYLLSVIDQKLLAKMVDEHYILDGELYLPGYSINEINHFVKDATCNENALIQYWCYDIAIEDMIQSARFDIMDKYLPSFDRYFKTKEEHLNNIERFITLPCISIESESQAITARDSFIRTGFEGLIMRRPDAEYQYGKRNLSMIKYKKSTDGKFKIVDIYPEGIKRNNIPLFRLKNDINDATFEVHISGNQEYQNSFLKEDIKNVTIGKYMFVEYGERSGVNDLPFHVKTVRLL